MAIEVKREVVEQYPYYYIKKYIYFRDKEEVAREILDRNGNVVQTIGKVPDGPVVERYPNGQIMGNWTYLNGKPDGAAKVFSQSGQMLKTLNYKNGKKEGICREYYSNGKLKTECTYKNGKLDGIATHYDATGNLVLKMKYNQGVLETGVDNRHLRLKGEVIRAVTVDYPDSRANEITYMIDGEEVAWEYLDPQGARIRLEGNIPDGVVKEYYHSGRLMGRYYYRNGKPEGIAKNYYETGNLKCEVHFRDGKREGPVRVYYESGMLQAEAFFKNGVLVDNFKYTE